jgi:hypothetical protein
VWPAGPCFPILQFFGSGWWRQHLQAIKGYRNHGHQWIPAWGRGTKVRKCGKKQKRLAVWF